MIQTSANFPRKKHHINFTLNHHLTIPTHKMTRTASQHQPKLRIPSQPPNSGPQRIPPRPALPKSPQDIRQTKEYRAAARR